MEELNLAINELEERLEIHSGFFESLLSEDDWSFVIKSHALIESSCSQLLTASFGHQELEEIFAKMELGEKNTGKIAFLRTLELLTDYEKRFIQNLSELRNKIVHNVKGVNFNFHEHLQEMDTNRKDKFISSFGICHFYDGNAVESPENRQLVLSQPKKTIWEGLKYIVATISVQTDGQNYRHQAARLREQLLER